MTEWSLADQQAIAKAIDVLDDEWTVALVATLAAGELQTSDILAALNGTITTADASERNVLSPRVLDDVLQRATKDGLVERNAENDVIDTVRYRLTANGQALLEALQPIAEWAQRYRGRLAK